MGGLRSGAASVLLLAASCGPPAPMPSPTTPPPPHARPEASPPVVPVPAPDDGSPLDVTARADAGSIPSPLEIRIADDGEVAVTLRPREAGAPESAYSIVLTESERAEWRRAFLATDFFGEWGRPRVPACHATPWEVTAELGPLRRERKFAGSGEFAPAERFLRRLVAQADASRTLRSGRWPYVELVRPEDPPRLLRPSALVPDLAACIAAATRDHDASQAASALLDLLPPEEWARTASDVLRRAEGPPRVAALGAWAHHLQPPERLAWRRAFLPALVAEVRAALVSWASLDDRTREVTRRLISLGVADGDPETLRIAEEMARTLSDRENAFFASLHLAGAQSVPVLLRLAADERPEARAAAARIGATLVAFALGKERTHRGDVPMRDRESVAQQVRDALIPALARLSSSPGEPVFVREACFRTLRDWEGIDVAAESRATKEALARRADERRRADEAQTAARAAEEAQRAAIRERWTGTLSISGRVVAAGEFPLAGFTVIATPEAATPEERGPSSRSAVAAADGGFRIEGLTDGRHTVLAIRPGSWGWREVVNNGTRTEGVLAGGPSVVLRSPGAMLLGRLVDDDGRPVVGRHVGARMRDAPNVLTERFLSPTAFDPSDSEGRFRLLQLLPGRYDLEIPGSGLLEGASGLVPGPEERIVRVLSGASISGRVLDELGRPVAGAYVGVVAGGRRLDGVVANTGKDGAYRLAGLDPSVRCRVFAHVENRTGTAEDVTPGATAIDLRVDTSPRLEGRVEFGRRLVPGTRSPVRLVRVGDGSPQTLEFRGTEFLRLVAPEGTWRVEALVRDLDAEGKPVGVWLALGEVRTGDPPRTFVVPE